MATILITEQIDPTGPALLEAAGHTLLHMETRDPSELAEKIQEADAVIVRILDIPAGIIEDAPRLKLISKHGVGVDNIDLAAAKRAGVAVTVTPGANSLSVAEHTIALLLSLSKNLSESTRQYREIGFAAKNGPPGCEVTGKTLGIIGCGRIGRIVGKIATGGFDMRLLIYDPYLTESPCGGELTADRNRVFREADFLTLHLPLDADTYHNVGAREFSLMKPTAIFLNCARGPLVEESALIRALQSGQIAAAGLDVTEQEPCPPDSPLFGMSNVLLTPHTAPAARETAVRVSRMAAENVIHYFRQEEVSGRII